MKLGKNTPVARAVCALACAVAGILIAAPAASARLAVIATGKTRVSIVDLSRKLVVAHPRIGLRTRAVALSSDGFRGYVASGKGAAGRLGVIDLPSRTVTARIALPGTARAVALSSDGTRAYVSGGGSAGRLFVVDLATGTVAAQIATPPRPRALAISPDGARADVTYGKRGFAIIDLTLSRTIKRLRVGRKPVALAASPSGRRVYVVNERSQSLSFVDADQRRVERTLRLRRPVATIALSRDGTRALVGPGRRSNKAIVVDLGRVRQLKRISIGRGPGYVSLSPLDARIFTAARGSGVITFASGYSFRRLVGSIRIGRHVVGMAVQPGYSLLISATQTVFGEGPPRHRNPAALGARVLRFWAFHR
jgi:DNA-binding beta-propeller fold protein YncE